MILNPFKNKNKQTKTTNIHTNKQKIQKIQKNKNVEKVFRQWGLRN